MILMQSLVCLPVLVSPLPVFYENILNLILNIPLFFIPLTTFQLVHVSPIYNLMSMEIYPVFLWNFSNRLPNFLPKHMPTSLHIPNAFRGGESQPSDIPGNATVFYVFPSTAMMRIHDSISHTLAETYHFPHNNIPPNA